MQYLLLIYEDEKRFATGFPDGEFRNMAPSAKNTPQPSKAETHCCLLGPLKRCA